MCSSFHVLYALTHARAYIAWAWTCDGKNAVATWERVQAEPPTAPGESSMIGVASAWYRCVHAGPHGLQALCTSTLHGPHPACAMTLHGLHPTCALTLHGPHPACAPTLHGLHPACALTLHGLSSA
eukprot:365259-Chlamydomonas_euryale.AAC.10